MSGSTPLRLLAHDADDLPVMSAALQDAVLKVGDIVYEPKQRRLTVSVNRFRWETGARGRVRAGLQIGGVLSVKSRAIGRDDPEAVLELLTIRFEQIALPGGEITLNFAGGGDLVAEVECVDAVLADVSSPWPTRRAPRHDP